MKKIIPVDIVTLRERVKKVMTDGDYSVREAKDSIGITHNTFSAFIYGTKIPLLSTLYKIEKWVVRRESVCQD